MRKVLTTLCFALILLLPTALSATYTQQAALANDGVFQGQVQVAMIQTCANAMTEAVTVTGHLQRMQLCVRVLQDPAKFMPIFSIVLASQANNPMTPLTVPSTVADSLVQTACDAQLSNMAGYFKQ
jgi:hypothetical protein